MDRQSALGCVAGLPLMGAPVAFGQIENLNDAINKAGRQRMLSQRMSKAYLALGMDVATKKAQDILRDSMAKFDRQLVELSAFAPRPNIKATYAELETVWGQYKTLLVGQAPQRETAVSLLELDDKLLFLANKGTVQLEEVSGKPIGRLVNVSGRQRMLSQRAAKFFLAQAWKAPVAQAAAKLQTARAEFTDALDVLEKAPEATAAIRQELDLARKQWVFFELALSYSGSGAKSAENVFLASENVLTVMETVTGLYARQVAN